MDIIAVFSVALLLGLPGIIASIKLQALEERLTRAEKASESGAETGEPGLEEAYRRGLAAIMSYGLREAAGEEGYE